MINGIMKASISSKQFNTGFGRLQYVETLC